MLASAFLVLFTTHAIVPAPLRPNAKYCDSVTQPSMEASTNNNVQLLATLVDPDENEESEYRFPCRRHPCQVRYCGTRHPPKGRPDVCPGRDSRPTAFPPGDWNEGHVGHDSASGEPIFLRITKADLPGVKSTWHATRIDHLELRKLDRLRQNIHKVSHPLFNRPLVAKYHRVPLADALPRGRDGSLSVDRGLGHCSAVPRPSRRRGPGHRLPPRVYRQRQDSRARRSRSLPKCLKEATFIRR